MTVKIIIDTSEQAIKEQNTEKYQLPLQTVNLIEKLQKETEERLKEDAIQHMKMMQYAKEEREKEEEKRINRLAEIVINELSKKNSQKNYNKEIQGKIKITYNISDKKFFANNYYCSIEQSAIYPKIMDELRKLGKIPNEFSNIEISKLNKKIKSKLKIKENLIKKRELNNNFYDFVFDVN